MPRSELILPLLLLAGCLAPRVGSEGEAIGIEDVGRMIGEGAEPVMGTVEAGREVPGGDPFALADPTSVEPEAAEEQDEPLENPYLHFGERIMVHTLPESGEMVITKPYPLPPGKGIKMLNLIKAIQPFPFRHIPLDEEGAPTAPDTPPDPNVVELIVMPDWDVELYFDRPESDMQPNPAKSNPLIVSDLLVATATYELLEEVEDFINLFGAGVRMIEIEAKIIEVVETDTLDVGIKPIADGVPIFDFPDGTFVDSLDFNLGNTTDPTEALLTLGAVQDGLAFNAILEALERFDNVSIDQKPRVAVREGVPASISSTQEIPYFTISSINPAGNFTSQLQFKSVGIELFVTPRVVGTDTLALDVQLIASQEVDKVVTFVTDSGGVLPTPLIATRTARTLVYLKPGQSLIIGGFTSERFQESVSQVPILGSIPLLGLLFRSKFEKKETAYSMFVISPRIIQGNEFNAEL